MRAGVALAVVLIATACGDTESAGGVRKVPVRMDGSLQNPCWSPDGTGLLFTRWTDGYNEGAAQLATVGVDGGEPATVTGEDEESINVNLPGSCWSRGTNAVAFVSDAELDHEEVHLVAPTGGRRTTLTRRTDVAIEASISPDGSWVVFESQPDRGGSGTIWKVRTDGRAKPVQLTSDADDRQPVWSPAGDRIVFQSTRSGNWDVWTMTPDGGDLRNVTDAPSSDTDPSFSPDGQFIVYSSDNDATLASLFVIPATGGAARRVTFGKSYDGAPSWSPDGRYIAFESAPYEPDGSAGTALWIIPADPALTGG